MPRVMLRFLRGYYALAVVMAAFQAAPAAAQGAACDPQLRPVPGSIGYAPRGDGGGHRCEGLYRSTVSSVRLQLVSVMVGRLAFDPEAGESMRIRAPDVPYLAERSIRVRAVALPLRTYYRMDATLSVESPLDWPLGDIVRRIDLPADSIGVYGWVEDDHDRIFVPLTIDSGAETGTADGVGPVHVMVRSAVNLQQLAWRIADEDGQVVDQQSYAQTPIRAGRTVAIPLVRGPTAMLQMDVAALPSQSSEWTSLRIRLLRPGP